MTASNGFFDDQVSEHGIKVPMDGRNRYLLPDADGKVVGWTRATTISRTLDDEYRLQQWQLRQVARGMGLRADLMARAGAADPDDKQAYQAELRDVVSTAMVASATDERRNLGTALHAVLARFDKGEPINKLPEYFREDVFAYQETLTRYGIKIAPQWVERTIKCDSIHVAGTLDNIVELPDGSLCVMDKKTEADPEAWQLDKPVQLAIYANADAMMDYETGRYQSVPCVRKDFALVAHMRPGSGICNLYRVDISRGWWAVRLAMEVREWRRSAALVVPYTDPTANVYWSVPIIQCAAPTAAASEQIHSGRDFFSDTSADEERVSTPLSVPESAKIAAKLTTTAQDAGNVPPQPTPGIDPETEVDELCQKSKVELQALCHALGITDTKRHKRPLAISIVKAKNSGKVASANGQAGPTIDLTIETILAEIASACDNDRLTDIYHQWTDAYGPDSWRGEVLAAATRRMQELWLGQSTSPQTTNPLG